MCNDLRVSIRTRDQRWHPPPEVEKGCTEPQETRVTAKEDSLVVALEQLRDVMLPVRAHGLVTLRRSEIARICDVVFHRN